MNPGTPNHEMHPLDAFFALPMMLGDAALCYYREMSQRWWRQFFQCARHPPEGHAQLVVPEPLEADDERDLFA